MRLNIRLSTAVIFTTIIVLSGLPTGIFGVNVSLTTVEKVSAGSDIDVFYEDTDGFLKYRDSNGDVTNLSVKVDGPNGIGGVGDMDGDGDLDIAFQDLNENIKYVDINGNVVDTGTDGESTGGDVGGVDDFDGDGDQDIVYKDDFGNIEYVDDNGNVGDTSVNGNDIGGIGDLDGDDSLEVVFGGTSITGVDSGGSTTALSSTAGTPGGVGDVDGDGDLDVVFNATDSDNTFYISYVDTGGSEVHTGTKPCGSNPIGGTGDFDDDGNVEVAFQNCSSDLDMYDVSDDTVNTIANTISGPGTEMTNMPTSSGGGSPYVTNIIPGDGKYLNTTNRSTNLNVSVDDPEDDPIDTTIYWNPVNGSGWQQVASEDDISAGGWLNTTVDASPGENWWKVETDDDVNPAQNSTRFEWSVGNQVVVYNGSDYTLANQSTLTINATSTETNWRNDSQITNAKFDWIPGAQEEHRVEISHPWKYKNTTVIIEDPAEAKFVLLTPNVDNTTASNWKNADKTHLQCFDLNDGTGNYPPSDTVLRANQFYDGEWRLADNDRFGANNNASLWLQDGEDYRLSIKNDDGDVRSLNEFTADSSVNGCITLVVESEDEEGVGPENSTSVEEGTINGTDVGYAWDTWRVENGTGLPYLKFEWELGSDDKSTESFQLQIYEFQNKSNRTIYNNSFGKINSINHRQDLNSSQENDTWVIQWNATVDGDDLSGTRILGPQDIGPGLPVDDFWKELAALASVLIVGGLAGGTRAEVGAILASLTAGIYFMLGWLPSEVGAGIILAALALGAMFYSATEGEPV